MKSLKILILLLALTWPVFGAEAFDYEKIYKEATRYTVIVTIETEVSFGTQTTDIKSRGIGTVVSPEGLVIFDGRPIDSEDPFSTMAGMQINAEPKRIEIKFFEGKILTAEFLGIDRYTKLGFCRIIHEGKEKFPYASFSDRKKFVIGEMLSGYKLLPEHISPPLAVDIGMVSAFIQEPEEFVLTLGFGEGELAAVLYDSLGAAVGMLGLMSNAELSSMTPEQMMSSFENMEGYPPLVGVITAEKVRKLIAEPPRKGEVKRGWLGIYLQALTTDIAEYWGLGTKGGIIVSEVVKDSPADTAGLRTGDIIIGLNSQPINVDREENIAMFQRQISDLGEGGKANFEILRRQDGTIDTLNFEATLTLAPMTAAEAADYEDRNFEFKVRDMVFADFNINNLDRKTFKGVVVKEVETGGWASIGELFPGDIIQKIGGEKITSVTEAQAALEKVAKDRPKEVVFFIWRDNKTLFLNVKTDW